MYNMGIEKFLAASVEVNATGGAQSKIEGRYDMIPGSALHVLAKVFGMGASKYARNNWRRIPFEDHINHAVAHLAGLMDDDRGGEDHLAHAFTRLAMAVAVRDSGDVGPPAFSFNGIGPEIAKT